MIETDRQTLIAQLRKKILSDRYFPFRKMNDLCEEIVLMYEGFLDEVEEPYMDDENCGNRFKDLLLFVEEMGGYERFDYDESQTIIIKE